MTTISIIGTGNMGSALADLLSPGATSMQIIGRDRAKAQALAERVKGTAATLEDAITGDIVVLALPYPAIDEVLDVVGARLAGKTLGDITNPVDFATFNGLVVPADSSAAAQIAVRVPEANVLKAFNTSFGGALLARKVAGQDVAVLVAGDDAEAKSALIELIDQGGLRGVDAGPLDRARELEALGFLSITLAAAGKTGWASGFILAP